MPKTARRRLSRFAGTSCLAAALALPAGVTSAVAAPGAVTGSVAALPAQPSPPPEPADPPPPPPPDPPDPADPPPPPPPDPADPPPPPPDPPDPADPPPPPDPADPPPPPPPPDSPPESQPKLTPDEEKDLRNGIAGLDVQEEVKEGLGDTLEKVQAALKDPGTPPEDKARIDKVLTQMTSTLRTIQDPGTTPEEKAQLTTIVAGMTEALRIALDEEAPATSKWYSMRASDMADTMKGLEAPGLPPETRALTLAHLESASAGLMALHAPQSEPEKPQDAKRVREVLEENFASVKSLQSPDSKERNRAKGKLDRLHGSLTDPEHRRFVEELKRLKAPAACLTSVENRTREVGWADGSLWGVTEQSCADTVSAGAADTSSDWSPLFRCLEQKPFSQCTGTVPKE